VSIRIGIIGCGAIAEEMHIPCVLRASEATLSALVDSDFARASELARINGGAVAGVRLDDVADQLDAVILATPPHTHLSLVQKACSRGLHVLCEKPLANTVAECELMIDAAVKAGKVLAAGHMYRFFPIRQLAMKLPSNHNLGYIRKVIATEGKQYSWPTVTGYTVRRDMVPGGVMINAGIHTLDSFIDWFGDPVDITYEDDAVGGLESNVRLRLNFRDGVRGFFRQSRTCSLPYRITFICDLGELSFSTNSIGEYTIIKNGTTEMHTCARENIDHTACWHAQLLDFVTSIREQRPPLVDGAEGTRVMRLIENCYTMKKARSMPSYAPIPGATW